MNFNLNNSVKLALISLGVIGLAASCAPGLAEPGDSPEPTTEQPIILQAGPNPIYMTCRISEVAPAATVPEPPPPEPQPSVSPSPTPPSPSPPPSSEAPVDVPEPPPEPPFRWRYRGEFPLNPSFPPGS